METDPSLAEPAPRLRRDAGSTLALQGLALLVNVGTGVLLARGLGTTDRGELTAVLTAAQMAAWLAGMGAQSAIPYHQARQPADASRLLGTWLVLAGGLGVAGAIAGIAILPAILAAQSDATLDLARAYMLTVVVLLALDVVHSFVLGAHHFLLYNVARVAGPLAMAAILGGLWVVDELTVETAAAATFGVNLVALGLVGGWAIRRYGAGRPDKRIARATLWYGARAHTTTVGGLVSLRLDLVIMPALLAASSVGLYTVATSASWTVASLASALAVIVLPLAARQGERGARTVVLATWVTLAVGTAAAATLAALAVPCVRLLYGGEFLGSVDALRLLLPGTVLWAATLVVLSGLNSLGRPGLAGATQVVSVAITIAGLVVLLPEGGIEAAAAVSSVAYAAAFACAVWLYRRVAGIGWDQLIRPSRLPA